MTALAGYWAFGRGEEPLGACIRMLDAQRIYGRLPALTHAAPRIALGKSLYPTLPEDAFDQGPVTGGGGRWVLGADVRLDDRAGLAATLGIAPDRAAALSDSALVMAAVERWEEETFGRLMGDFAIALWDSQRERLILARDFAGQRPLHYHRGPGFFAFASMPSGLRALPGAVAGADEDALAAFLSLQAPEGNRSFLRGVEKLRPGEIHVVTAAGTQIARHWSPPVAQLRLKRSADYVEAVREAFDRAVASRLRGAGDRVATHLSGGLDSGGVTATAARLIGPAGRVDAFTSVPAHTGFDRRGRFADEQGHAAAVAALYPNVAHVPIRTAGRSPIAGLDRNFAFYQAPALNLCNFVWGDAIAEEAQRRGHNVLLTGQVGNFTFSHPGAELLGQLLARGRWLRLLREGRALRRGGLAVESIAGMTLRPLLPAALWSLANRLRGRRLTSGGLTALHPDARARVERAGGTPSGLWRTNDLRVAALQASEFGNFRQGTLAGLGLDVRDPTSDRRLFELCLSIPADQYLAGGQARALARRVLADRLPQVVLAETRKGFQGTDWHLGLVAAWDDIADEVDRIDASPAARRLIDVDRLRRLLDGPRQRDWNSAAAQADYRFALLRGVSAGHFIRSSESPS